MEHFNSLNHDFDLGDKNLNNIVRMNAVYEDDESIEDYDFDYDPNEMYFALNSKD